MDSESDPRVYFAAERTQLAWLRTGIAVIGLGFLVARFGVFLITTPPEHYSMTLSLGIAALVSLSGIVLAIYLALSVTMMQPASAESRGQEKHTVGEY